MLAQKLATSEVWRAIEVYLRHAYTAAPPSAVRARLETLRSLSGEDFYLSPAFERDSATAPTRLSLRLGNKLYPHMKLTIERAPDKHGFLFRADTHDSHCCPAPGTRDYPAFCSLMEGNQQVAQAIENAWAEEHLPTFKTFLRDDLARRVAAAAQKPVG